MEVVILIDKLYIKKSFIYNEFDEVENTYWFDFKQKKFLHNIDTFYYSVKFKNDFTNDSKDLSVKRFRRKFDAIGQSLARISCVFSDHVLQPRGHTPGKPRRGSPSIPRVTAYPGRAGPHMYLKNFSWCRKLPEK